MKDGNPIPAAEQPEQGPGGFPLLIIGSCESVVGVSTPVEMGSDSRIDFKVIVIRNPFDDGDIRFLHPIFLEGILELSARS